jgi:FkbM family methyltransferase
MAAQQGEDKKLWSVLSDRDNGFYVDVGCNDPVVGSISESFYEAGWDGIAIDPLKRHINNHRELRPHQTSICCACGAAEGEGTLHVTHLGGLETMKPTVFGVSHNIAVPIIPLDTILEDYGAEWIGEIQWLSIDVEGYEREVLKGANLKYWQPWYLCIEAREPCQLNHPTWDQWEDLVLAAGYSFNLDDGLNRFYSRDDKPRIEP